MTPSVVEDAALQIQTVETATLSQLIAVVRGLSSVRIGARFERVRRSAVSIDLTLTEIRRYPDTVVDELDQAHAARVVLTGSGATTVRTGEVIEGTNPRSQLV